MLNVYIILNCFLTAAVHNKCFRSRSNLLALTTDLTSNGSCSNCSLCGVSAQSAPTSVENITLQSSTNDATKMLMECAWMCQTTAQCVGFNFRWNKINLAENDFVSSSPTLLNSISPRISASFMG
ncbi:hypothetical protein HELRODRAFT_176479 [Helobdella robusta]|uniref:Apple domain-containing protein n=1 Tax=Helobdella robusta TaxID=6412 RepID=T1FAK0_HELRO|nr:hypothetical protein HELRODRAFT_176479 [Helobdella robusta]ESN99719.1 hypothetical protein HELRODRAFT_176479 [Helobdella robusta]